MRDELVPTLILSIAFGIGGCNSDQSIEGNDVGSAGRPVAGGGGSTAQGGAAAAGSAPATTGGSTMTGGSTATTGAGASSAGASIVGTSAIGGSNLVSILERAKDQASVWTHLDLEALRAGASLGMQLGKLEEVRMSVEGQNNSGTIDFTTSTVVVK